MRTHPQIGSVSHQLLDSAPPEPGLMQMSSGVALQFNQAIPAGANFSDFNQGYD